MNTSGSGIEMEDNDTFSCIRSELNTTGITNATVWTILPVIAAGRFAVAFIQVVFFIVGSGWNLFICITYLIKYPLLKEPANIMLFSLALSDLMICSVLVPVSFTSIAANEFPFGSTDPLRCNFCFASSFFAVYLVSVSLCGITVLSIDRLTHLSNPLKYKQRITWLRALIAVIITWIFCFMMAVPPAFGFGEWEFNINIGYCLPRWTGYNKTQNVYYMIMTVLFILVATTILAITSTWTFVIVKKFLKVRHQRESSFKLDKAKEEDQYKRKQRQLLKVFGALLVANLIAWTPLIVVFILLYILNMNDLINVIPNWIYTIGWLCFLSSSVVHPIIESSFIKELRHEVCFMYKKFRSAGHDLVCVPKTNLDEIEEGSARLRTYSATGFTNQSLSPEVVPAVTVSVLPTTNNRNSSNPASTNDVRDGFVLSAANNNNSSNPAPNNDANDGSALPATIHENCSSPMPTNVVRSLFTDSAINES